METSTNHQTVATSLEPTVLAGDRVRVGDLTLDLPKREISGRGTNSVELSKNEFTVLATLLKDAGRVVAREQLHAVLAQRDETDLAVVDTYVMYLRGHMIDVRTAATIERHIDGYILKA